MSPKTIRTVPGDYQYFALHRGNRIQRFWHKNKIALIEQILPMHRTDIVLDIGCGSGNFVIAFAAKCSLMCGMDVLGDAVWFAHKSANGVHLQNVHCVRASAQSIPLADNSVDKILFLDVVEHLRKPQEALTELARILRPKGKALLTTPNLISIWPIVEYAADILGIGVCRRFIEYESKYSMKRLAQIIEDSGLSVVKMGSVYFAAPLAALLSESISRKLFGVEIVQSNHFGMLLYCLAEKRE